ncbi:MAG: glycerol-3-phosphate dehydrogenase/oxidase [Promethearchaeota archaeon]
MIDTITNTSWSSKHRDQYINRLKNETFDLLVIGGGITGAGIVREAALRGLKAALIDKNDFAFGTSSRSSKMAHGGFRYLAYHEFKIVREATTERNWLRAHFTHNVRPLTMYMIGAESVGIPASDVKLGIRIYDLLSNVFSSFKQYGKHRFYEKDEAIKIQPNMRIEGLESLGKYYDTNVDDARLVIETIKESVYLGDCVAVNYVSAENFVKQDENQDENQDGNQDENQDGKIVGVSVHDGISDETFQISANHVINATGIWTDELLPQDHRKIIRPTKGVHVVVPSNRVGNVEGIGMTSIDDGRTFFVLNREGITLIGTTDTDYLDKKNGQPNEDLGYPYCNQEDCDYLFKSVNYLFPEAKLTYEDIISTFAGVRPLVMEEGKDESAVSRKHAIFDSEGGLTTICGGKLTTFRKMAEDLLYHLFLKDESLAAKVSRKQKKKNYSKKPYLINLTRAEWNKYLQSEKSRLLDLPSTILEYLYVQYGKGAMEIVDLIKENPDLGIPLLENHPFIPAEVQYCVAHEMVYHLFDMIRRRTEIFMLVKHTQQHLIAEKIATIMAPLLGWDDNLKQQEISTYLDHIKHTVWF